VSKCDPPVVWRLLRAVCTAGGPAISHVWAASEAFASQPDGLNALIESGAVAHLLGAIFGVSGYVNNYNNRLSAISLLSKFLWNPVRGGEASMMLRRFLPEPVVLLMRSKAGSASLQVLDDVCENPELIWTGEMQGEIREALTKLLTKSQVDADNFRIPVDISVDYTVPYRQLSSELYVGGVYVRLFLKQPTFQLSNAIFFTEKLVEFWESSFNTQVPFHNRRQFEDPSSESSALVLGKEDFLTLLTSCIICVVKNEYSVVDHLLGWGFVHTLTDLLRRAIDMGRRGAPVISVVRLLHQLVSRTDTVDNLSSAPTDVIRELTRSLNDNSNSPQVKPSLNKESAFMMELLKKIYQCAAQRGMMVFVQMGMQASLPNFILDNVLASSEADLSEVRFLDHLHTECVCD
jgi:hypothetical protein